MIEPTTFLSGSVNPQPQPSDSVKALIDDLRFDAIGEFMQLLQSYARSGEESAWRREARALEQHLMGARATLTESLRTLGEINGEGSAP